MYDDLLGDLGDCLDRIVGGDINREREVADLIERCMRAIEASRSNSPASSYRDGATVRR